MKGKFAVATKPVTTADDDDDATADDDAAAANGPNRQPRTRPCTVGMFEYGSTSRSRSVPSGPGHLCDQEQRQRDPQLRPSRV